MKSTSFVVASIITLFIITGCGKETEKPAAGALSQGVQQQQAAPPIKQGTPGKVLEKINDGEGYTFLLIDTGKEKFWVATPALQISVGSTVVAPEGTRMTNFHNKPLNRDFDSVVFVDTVTPVPSGQTALPPSAGVPAATPR